MGTQKRERQKANRQQRQIEEAKADRSSAIKRNVIRWSLAALLAIVAVVVIAWIGGAFSGDDDDVVSTLPPVDTSPVDTSPVDTTPVTSPPGGTTAPDPATGKPSVSLPAEPPTELVITDITEGDGDPAEAGDVVEVNYVGFEIPNSFVVGYGLDLNEK